MYTIHAKQIIKRNVEKNSELCNYTENIYVMMKK